MNHRQVQNWVPLDSRHVTLPQAARAASLDGVPLFLVGKPDPELRELMEKAGAPSGVKPFLDGPIFTPGLRGVKR